MRDADAFEGTTFLGLAKRSKRDPYRLGLFAAHLEPDERPLVFLAVQGGTVIVTDRRVLEFRAHLEVHGAWNVKEFQGYEVRRNWDRLLVRGVEHTVAPSVSGPAGTVEDSIRLSLPDRVEAIVVSKGPQPTLTREDFEILRTAVSGQPK
jgi:hypothetical protein